MASIRYRVPYQIDVLAKDLSSGKRIGTTHYAKTGKQSGSEPAYGAPIAGGGNTTTMLASFATIWEALVLAVVSVKYQMLSYTMRAITGYGYSSPVKPIVALAGDGTKVIIQTATAHGLTTSQLVSIKGVLTPTGLNSTFAVIVVDAYTFQIASTAIGVWTGPGSLQKVGGGIRLQYADTEFLASSAIGGIAGDALPIYADIDVRRLNPGVGKSFRSRFSMTPVAEDSNDFGKLKTAAIASVATALSNFNVGLANGGSTTDSNLSYFIAFSKLKAMQQTNPFTDGVDFSEFVSSFSAHANLGTQIRRKPKLATS